MDRVLISWSVPNLITINLMCWLGLLLAITLWQFFGAGKGQSVAANNQGQY